MKLLVLLLLSVFAIQSNAHNCIGKVTLLDVDAAGFVNIGIEGIGGGNSLCSLTTTYGEFMPEACKAAFSLLLSAKMSGKNVQIYFRDNKSTSCVKGDWVSLATSGVYYVRLSD